MLGKLSAVDPEFGQVTKTIDVAGEALGSTNGSVATGADAVWAVYGDSTLARIDPIDIEVTGKGVTGTAPAGIVVAYGYVWVVNTDSATVQRFDPATFDAGPLGTPTSVGLRPTAIAAGEGAIWVANTGADTVERIQPAPPVGRRRRNRSTWATRRPAWPSEQVPSGSRTPATGRFRVSTLRSERS